MMMTMNYNIHECMLKKCSHAYDRWVFDLWWSFWNLHISWIEAYCQAHERYLQEVFGLISSIKKSFYNSWMSKLSCPIQSSFIVVVFWINLSTSIQEALQSNTKPQIRKLLMLSLNQSSYYYDGIGGINGAQLDLHPFIMCGFNCITCTLVAFPVEAATRSSLFNSSQSIVHF